MDGDSTEDQSDRVELLWPKKHEGARVFQEPDGRWNIEAGNVLPPLRGLSNLSYYTKGINGTPSLLISGQRHDALVILRRSVGATFRLIYIDLPRLDVDDKSTAFQSISSLRLTTWLSIVRALLIESRELLSRDGVVAVHCGEDESHYAKAILDEIFRDKRVATIIWQKAYSPMNMPGMKEFTDTHDLIYVYARDKDSLPAVGLRRPPEDYTNPDSDPRGAWKAEHKGAKTYRENSDFDTYQPPYRWRLAAGSLPPGIWRVAPFTGVIWGRPTAVGNYEFAVELSDKNGSKVTRNLSINVTDHGTPPPLPEIPWIFEQIDTKGPLSIDTTELPSGIVGETYSAVIIGRGGQPFVGPPIRPGSGRYWDLAKNTLLTAYQLDSVNLGKLQPTSIPTPKKYEPPAGVHEIENQQSIWLGRQAGVASKASEVFAGYTQDATKHLKALKALGLIEAEVPTVKPEKLLLRLLEVFTDRGDLVLEAMSSSADLSAVALKSGRRFIALQGCSPYDVATTAACALPRLKAVVDGSDNDLIERAPAVKLSHGAYIPFSGGGSFVSSEVGAELALLPSGDDHPILTEAVMGMTDDQLMTSMLTATGYLPPAKGARYAFAIEGPGRALFVPPSEYLTPESAAEIASDAELRVDGHPTTVFYFRATEDIDEKFFGGRISLRRIPFDLLQLDVF